MFTPYMTNAELQREAYLDYLEIRPSIRISFEQFRHQNGSFRYTGRPVLHSLTSTKEFRTKRGNTWRAMYSLFYHTMDNRMIISHLIYIPIYKEKNQIDYIFLQAPLHGFSPEKLTSHFLQRYKERYLVPNHVNTRGISSAVYFERTNTDRRPTDFYPAQWTEEEKKNKVIWLSDQGLMVTTLEDKMWIYVTFLDEENLSLYKAQVYEEEDLMRYFYKINEEKDQKRRSKMMDYFFSQPNAMKVINRFFHRVIPKDYPDREAFIKDLLNSWKKLENMTEHIIELKENVAEQKQHDDYLYLTEDKKKWLKETLEKLEQEKKKNKK